MITTVHAPDLASSCSDTVSKNIRKSFVWGDLQANFLPHGVPDECASLPWYKAFFSPPHFSIFRQEQTVTVIRKQSTAGLEEPGRAKADFQTTQLLPCFFGFQFRLQSQTNDWVGGICCSNPFTNEWQRMRCRRFYTPRQTGLKLKVITEKASPKAMIGKEPNSCEKEMWKNISPVQSKPEVCKPIKQLDRPSTNGL